MVSIFFFFWFLVILFGIIGAMRGWAKEILEPKGMTVNAADVEAFRAKARDEVWPKLKEQYADIWDKIVETK